MKSKFLPVILPLALYFYFVSDNNNTQESFQPQIQAALERASIKTDSLLFFDKVRNRNVPVTLYRQNKSKGAKQKVAIINHGYGVPHTAYSAIANNLAAHGYFVASIQHDLPGDTPIPNTGNVIETRKPYWESGVQNILFVIQELKNKWPKLDYQNTVLIGHSYGGDIVMLFAHEHPDVATKVISLDNRRMPFPRISQPRLFSLRSSDQPADPGVLPTPEEQEKHKITIIPLKNTIHNDMNDAGTAVQKQEINNYILDFLK
jgi:dienelactone hydrolase